MPLFAFEGKSPKIHPTASSPHRQHHRRCDGGGECLGLVQHRDPRRLFPLVIRRGANVQDCSVIHVTPAGGTDGGPGATIGPLCMVHAAIIGEAALVGNASTVLDGARIGARSMIAAGSLVTPGTEIPEGVLAMGAPCKVRGPLAGTPAERWVQMNPAGYQALAQRHRVGVTPA